MLITTIEELNTLTGIGQGNSYERYEVHLQNAEQDQLKPILGEALYETLVADYTAEAIADEPDLQLLAQAQAVVANFGLAESLDQNQLHISDQGIHKSEESAYQYQKVEAQNSFFRRGFRAVEHLLQFLEKHKDTYPDWKQSEAYFEQRSFLIPSATEFQKHYNIKSSRRTYLELLPFMRRVEQFQIENILAGTPVGADKYQALILTVQDDAGLTEAEKTTNLTLLNDYVRPAVAYLTMSQAIPELNFKVTSQGVYLSEEVATNDKASSRELATDQQKLRLAERNADTADQYLQRLREHLAAATVAPQSSESPRNPTPPKKLYGL